MSLRRQTEEIEASGAVEDKEAGMRFKVGDKVIVKSFSKRPQYWNTDGEMDKYMGKVVTIQNIVEYPLYTLIEIEEAKEENSGEGWTWLEEDFLPIPKPGDRVRLRTWEDMEKQYGLNEVGGIKITPSVVSDMKKSCGNIVTVTTVVPQYFHIDNDGLSWRWSFNTIAEVYPKEEEKIQEFTKDMLKSGEHVVELRNGTRYLYIGKYLIGEEGGDLLSNYTDNLTVPFYTELDICKVYKTPKQITFMGIMENADEVIWERKEEPKDVPASEVYAMLREKYGCECKIIEDK